MRDLPGGIEAWLVLAVLALAGYTLLLACWLRARGAEAVWVGGARYGPRSQRGSTRPASAC